MGRLHVKFHEDRCKGEAVMRLKPFYLTAQSLHCDLDLWPFDPKVHRAHTWLMGGLHVKFHEDRCKGEAFIRLKPFYLTARLQTDGRTDRQTDRRTDRQTDGQGDSSISPPLTSLRGYNNVPLVVEHMNLELACQRCHPALQGNPLLAQDLQAVRKISHVLHITPVQLRVGMPKMSPSPLMESPPGTGPPSCKEIV